VWYASALRSSLSIFVSYLPCADQPHHPTNRTPCAGATRRQRGGDAVATRCEPRCDRGGAPPSPRLAVGSSSSA
jgi:hypothetical protein